MKIMSRYRARAAHATLAVFAGCLFSYSSIAVTVGLSDIEDVWVAPLLSSQWTMGYFGGDKAFNLYTPNNYSCGCGITAYAQVMRYWCAPAGPVASASFRCWVGNESRSVSTMGGPYDWDAMPLVSDDCVSQRQREALGRLAYDLGAASHVAWANDRFSISYGILSVAALTDYFRYASARIFISRQTRRSVFALDDYKNAILASLDAGMPVVIGIRTAANEGHQAVVDGYGFGEDRKLYCHMNFGWNGASDGWYNLIEDDFSAGGAGEPPYQFGFLEEVAYNIDPNVSGDVISGRVLDGFGNPLPNVTVRLRKEGRALVLDEGVSNEKGIYSVRFQGSGEFRLLAEDATHGKAELSVSVSKAGASPTPAPGLDFAVPYSAFALAVTPASLVNMAVANRWGNDLVLNGEDPAPVPVVPSPPAEPLFKDAATIDGYLLDGENVAGTILVKAGKANKGSGESKLTATVILKGQPKKLSFKGIMAANGDATLACNGQPALMLRFDARTMTGSLGNTHTVRGTRNLFTSKNKSEVAEANEMLGPWLGVVNAVWDEGSLSATIAAKGKVKISGTLDGKRVSATGQVLLGETEHVVPVVIVKPASLAFMLHLPSAGGAVEVSGIDSCVAGRVGVLGSSARFTIDREAAIWGQLPGTVLVDQLPDVEISQDGIGAKWSVPKAGKVVYQRGTTEVDPAKAGENPSGLKLSHKAKDGTFKGSFKAYSDVGGKLKATSVSVTGVQIGSKGYGTATVKGLGSVPVTIE